MGNLEMVEKIIATLVGISTFWGIMWKLWVKKAWIQYKATRDQWRITLLEELMLVKDRVEKVTKQVYPNGGSSLPDKVDKILDNQVILKENYDALIYLDETPTVRFNMLGECIFSNLAWLRLTGFNSPDEAYGLGWLKAIHPDDREKERDDFREAIRSNTLYTSYHRKVNLITGKEIPVKKSTKVISNSKGEGVEIIATVNVIK